VRDGIRVIENQSVRDTVAPVVARKNEPTGPSDRIKETLAFRYLTPSGGDHINYSKQWRPE